VRRSLQGSTDNDDGQDDDELVQKLTELAVSVMQDILTSAKPQRLE
jgi:hypothetical protein